MYLRSSRSRLFVPLILFLAALSGCNGDGETPAPVDTVGLERIVEGLTSPVLLREALDDSGRLFIVDQVGVIRILTPDGDLLETPFLDLQDQIVDLMPAFDERGLLGLAFHPEYATNGRFFVYYSAPLRDGAPQEYNHTSHVSQLTVSETDENVADPSSERILLQVDQPQFNHDAGTLAFGPDGFLYISLGDGGGANDVGEGHPPLGNGQDSSTLLGSILRIDVDQGDPFAIPEDNPYVGMDGRDEIFARGFRNPFRMSFDQGGDRSLFVGDAGQDLWEEVSIVTLGGNYGWNIREGTHCFDPENPTEPPDTCPEEGPEGKPLIDPIIEYRNANAPGGIGLVVIGGFVYRGSNIPELEGTYVFGDYSAAPSEPMGKLFAATRPADGEGLWDMRELSIAGRMDGALGAFLLGFGQDNSGEIYVLLSQQPGPTGTTGEVYRVVAPDMMDNPVNAQIQNGADLFADNCARCHGAMGMGTAIGPALVGPDALPLDPPAERILRTGQFRTAADVFAFASENMPLDSPGTLPTQGYVDILAFALDANGIMLDEPLTTGNADEITINPVSQ